MDAGLTALRAACPHHLSGDGPVDPARLLAAIGDVEPDRYGDGGVVGELEAYVADLLGKPAAVFLPSGTMAQAATLRVHAEQRGGAVAWHPTCHLELHERDAYARVHGLTRRLVGSTERWPVPADLDAVAEPLAAVLVEVPMRELGGTLPTWPELQALVAAARARGAAVHLDGARIWEAAAGYGRPATEVAALFDTAYVSFYKGIGALPGCCVVGPVDVLAQVREWRHRLGGTLFGLWPGAASALRLLPEQQLEMPARLDHARAIAAALRGVPGVTVVPEVPHTAMAHLLLDTTAAAYAANHRRLAEDRGVWAWPEPSATADPRVLRVELSVGRATLRLTAADVAAAVGALVA